jgi:hypothetical protein
VKKAILAAGLLVFTVSTFAGAQDQLIMGTWKANVAKSRYVPGAVSRNEVLRIDPVGDRFKVTLDGINQQGPYHSEATGKFDGVDVPVFAAPPRQAEFTYAFRRIDGHTWEILIKVNGAPQIVVRNVVSADGQTMTATSTAINAGVVNQVVVYEKQ